MKKIVGLAVLGLLAFVGVVMLSDKEQPVSSPEQEAFEAADRLIFSDSKGLTHGNSPVAEEMAKRFSENMKFGQSLAFTGGKKDRKVSLTKGEFLTYCNIANDAVVFLAHVPQFKRYKGDVRDALLELSWAVAKATVKDAMKTKNPTIVIGLKGSTFYGATAIGKLEGEPKYENAFSVDESIFHEYFKPVSPKKEDAGDEESAKEQQVKEKT